ncbi:putative zinc finger RNA-binding protein 2 isoform X2, partial [Microtus ochrogaster]
LCRPGSSSHCLDYPPKSQQAPPKQQPSWTAPVGSDTWGGPGPQLYQQCAAVPGQTANPKVGFQLPSTYYYCKD